MRKREKPEHDNSPETEKEISQRSKVVVRVHQQTKPITFKTTGNSEDSQEDTMEEVMAVLREIQGDIKDMKRGIERNNDEMKNLGEEIRIMKKDWNEEKEEIREQLRNANERIEKLEKDKIRNNLVVTGIGKNMDSEDLLKQTVERMIKKELDMEMKIKTAYKIGEERCIVEMEQWADKLRILKAKNRLRGKDVFIDSAMTVKEREIQKFIRDFAKAEKTKGASVKVKYQKIEIDGKTLKWNAKEQKLTDTQEVHTNKSKN